MKITNKLLTPPTFTDLEKNRIASLLHFMLLTSMALLVGSILYHLLFSHPDRLRFFVSTSLVGGIVFVTFYLLHRGAVKAAVILFIGSIWLVLLVSAYFERGIWSPSFSSIMLLIVAGGLLLGVRFAMALTLLSSLAGFGFVYAEFYNLLPPFTVTAYSPLTMLFNHLIEFTGVTALIYLANQNIRSSLHQAYSNEQKLMESNQQLALAQEKLESQVNARTRNLEKVVNLSERLTAILDFDHLLHELVDQVQLQFGYYHVQLYLRKPNASYLEVGATTGTASNKAMHQAETISLHDRHSVMAQAVRSRQPIQVDDISEVEQWNSSQHLPETRSEIAVPIMLAETPLAQTEVVGVLDVQQDRVAGFEDGTAELLRSLANQVAIAIRNARMFAQFEASLAQAEQVQERYVTQAWERDKVQPTLREYAQPAEELPVAYTYEAPIKLRKQLIGSLEVQLATDKTLNEDDSAIAEAVADQLAQMADNLRLFEETHERATHEQAIRTITERMQAASDLTKLLEITAEELGRYFALDCAVIELGLDEQDRLSQSSSPQSKK